jgi:hypothetical protein
VEVEVARSKDADGVRAAADGAEVAATAVAAAAGADATDAAREASPSRHHPRRRCASGWTFRRHRRPT